MAMTEQKSADKRVYRVDSFVVPAAVRDEFLRRVMQTHEVLRRQDGFIQDFILERASDDRAHVLVTIVEWRSEAVVSRVREAVAVYHKHVGFDPREFIAQAGIDANIGLYRAVEE